jgi:hypothetical protein
MICTEKEYMQENRERKRGKGVKGVGRVFLTDQKGGGGGRGGAW